MKLVKAVLACTVLLAIAGCEEKKKVVDVKTPIGDVSVTQDQDTGDVDVDVNAGAKE